MGNCFSSKGHVEPSGPLSSPGGTRRKLTDAVNRLSTIPEDWREAPGIPDILTTARDTPVTSPLSSSTSISLNASTSHDLNSNAPHDRSTDILHDLDADSSYGLDAAPPYEHPIHVYNMNPSQREYVMPLPTDPFAVYRATTPVPFDPQPFVDIPLPSASADEEESETLPTPRPRPRPRPQPERQSRQSSIYSQRSSVNSRRLASRWSDTTATIDSVSEDHRISVYVDPESHITLYTPNLSRTPTRRETRVFGGVHTTEERRNSSEL